MPPLLLFTHLSWRKGANENGTISWGRLVGRIPNLFSDFRLNARSRSRLLCGGFSVSGLLSTKNSYFSLLETNFSKQKNKKTQVTFTLNPNEFVFSNYVFLAPCL